MPAASRLPRRLSAFDATTLVVSNMIGTGIFFTTGWVAADVPSGPGILAAWLVGGVLAAFGALSYAELAVALPHAGGEYVYLREAYGPLLGFLAGWTSLFIGFAAPVAIGMLAFGAYVAVLAPTLALDRVLFALPGVTLTGASLLALAVLAALVGAHFLGPGTDRRVHVAVTVAKLVAIGALVVVALGSGAGSWGHLAAEAPDGSWSATAFVASIVPISYSYSGWDAAAYVAEEVRAPERSLPLALLGGTAVVVAVYLALNAVYLYALPVAALRGVDAVAAAATAALLGPRGGAWVSVVIALSILGAVNAMLLVGARVLYAMARDGVFFRFAARLDPRTGVPGGGVLGIAGVAAAMVLLGDLRSLLEFAGFTLVVFNLLAVTGVFVLRRTRPDLPRPYRVWGYPAVPAAFTAFSLYLVYASFVFNLRASAAGLGLVALGVPAYRLLRARAPGA